MISSVEVSTMGADDDGDGIPNAIDNCSETISGVQVDSSGCSIAQLSRYISADPYAQEVNCVHKETGRFRLATLCNEDEEVDANLDGIVDVGGSSSSPSQLPTECPAQ